MVLAVMNYIETTSYSLACGCMAMQYSYTQDCAMHSVWAMISNYVKSAKNFRVNAWI